MKWTAKSEQAFDKMFGTDLKHDYPLAYEVLHQMTEGCAWTRAQEGINPTMTVSEVDIAMVSGLIDRMREESDGQDTSGDRAGEAGGEGEESGV